MEVPKSWQPLTVPVPPVLEEACGYPGDARFVAFHWTPIGDECDYDDGCMSGTGDWTGFLGFAHHPKIAPALAGFDFGSGDSEARYYLVLDRQARVVYAVPAAVARRFLSEAQRATAPQPPVAEDAATTLKEFLDLDSWKEVEIDNAAIEAAMRRRDLLMKQMLEFLDK